MKKLLGILVLGLLISVKSFAADLTSQLSKLEDLYESGKITKEELLKSKSILIKIDLNKKKQSKKSKIIIRKFKKNSYKFHENMEMIIGDYRIYTHRPGAIKVRRISDNKQLIVVGDKFKVKYYNDYQDIFKLDIDEENLKLILKINDVPILHWEGRYIKKHRAYFYQMYAIGSQPFHYYIVLEGGKPVSLNMEKFQKKIDKAVAKAKVLLAQTHNITVEQINLLLKRREEKASKQIEKIISEKEEEITREETQKAIEASINREIEQQLSKELETAIGKVLAEEFVSAIEQATGEAVEQALEDELAAAIDAAVAEAVEQGISRAAVEAGLSAYLQALAAGKSEQQAYDEGCAAAGQESGC